MTNEVVLKRSNVAGKKPTTAQLTAAELAVNTSSATPGLFFGTESEVIEVATLSSGKLNSSQLPTITVDWTDITNPPSTIAGYGIVDAQQKDTDLTAIADLTTTGFISRVAPGTATTRSITGTANTITITNGDGVSDDPLVTIADDPVLPGTAKVTFPSGTTAQRPASPIDGDSRLNTTLGFYEQYYNGTWHSVPRNATLGAVQARRTTTLTTTTTATDITFDTVSVASNTSICNRDSTNTQRFVAYEAGTYEFNAVMSVISSNNSSVLTITFKLNGTTTLTQGSITDRPASTTAQDVLNTSCFVTLAANDYITLQISHASSASTVQVGASVMMKKLEGAQGNAGAFGGNDSTRYQAASLESPNNANWYSSASAPVQADATNTALTVRAFDDTLLEGVGATLYVPPSATSIVLTITHRAATAPASAKAVILQIANRAIPINSAITSWSSPNTLATVNIPTNALFQTFNQTIALSTLGLVAGVNNQIQLIRNGASASDTLVGDWILLDLTVSWS